MLFGYAIFGFALQGFKSLLAPFEGCLSWLPCLRRAAVAAFAGALHCGFSGGVSLAVGPLGRQAEVTMQVRDINGCVSFVAQ
jgi:hypothetical protein